MKLRIVLAVVLITVFAIPLAGQDQSAAMKMMMYENQKKNPTTAGLLSCCLSSSGHYYAGNWSRGLKFTAGRYACAIIAVTMGFEQKTTREDTGYGYYIETTEIEFTPLYTIGSLGATILAVWEIIDAGKEAQKYNERLYQQIMGGDAPLGLGMNITPLRDGAAINFAYTF